MKYNRNYEIEIFTSDGKSLKVGLPFSCDFEIFRNSHSSANVASFRLYNLSPESRGKLNKNVSLAGTDQRTVKFSGGYGDKLSLGFAGYVGQIFSTRQGVDMITQIESYDGGYQYVNASTERQYESSTAVTSIIDDAIKNMGLKKGAIGNFSDTLPRGNSYSGPTMCVLSDVTGDNAFIDNGVVNALKDTEAIGGEKLLINSSSGLLGTPTLEGPYITCEMLFEPTVRVGYLVKLETTGRSELSGVHRVVGIRHKGMISSVVSGSVITSLTLLRGSFVEISAGG